MSAVLLRFPQAPVRCLLVGPAGDGDESYFARYYGQGEHVFTHTQPGPVDLVMETITAAALRCGLPIIAPDRAVRGMMEGRTPLRPQRQRPAAEPSDSEKYARALAQQQLIADLRRFKPARPVGEGDAA